jgi:hypothetical protein
MADTTFWPGDARLAITISMMFEANGQPISGAGGPITEPIKPGYPDLATNTYFDYGMREGIPRLLDLFDRHARWTYLREGVARGRGSDDNAFIIVQKIRVISSGLTALT